MTTVTAGFPATPKHAADDSQPAARLVHGMTAVLPGRGRCDIHTFSVDDSDTIASMLRHAGCETRPLFDVVVPIHANGYSR